jgi:hypothetical protein
VIKEKAENDMRRVLIIIFMVLISATTFSQEATQQAAADYRVDESGRIFQRISWTRANVYFYEVEIEWQNEAGEWTPELKERTTEIFIETALAPGMYRYRILNYNILERVAATSDWVGIRVFIAKTPKVERTSPAAYYIDNAEKEFTLVLEGADFMDGAEVLIAERKEGAVQNPPPNPKEVPLQIQPLSVQYSRDENSIELVFSTEGLALGPYDITVINPGGLQTVYSDFQVTFRRALDVNVSLGYMPALPLSGYLFDTFSDSAYPVSFYGRVSVVPLKRPWGFIGAEFTPQISSMKTETDKYTVNGTMMTFALDGLYQWWFSNRVMAVNFRLGGGLAAVTGIRFEHKDGSASEEVATVLAMMNTGVSFEWLVWRDLFVEAGFEYMQMFSSISPAPALMRVNVGAGWRF